MATSTCMFMGWELTFISIKINSIKNFMKKRIKFHSGASHKTNFQQKILKIKVEGHEINQIYMSMVFETLKNIMMFILIF